MPPRKPTRSSGRKGDDALRLEQKRLLEEQEALLRQQEKARRLIEEAPKKLQEMKRRQREPIKITLKATRAGQTRFGGPHDKFGEAAMGETRRPRVRKAEKNAAKLQFVLFVVILAIITFMVWRAIPTM